MKKFIIGLSIIITVFGILIYRAAPTLTTYRDVANFSADYNKYCGYLIHCQYYEYYKPGTLGIEIYQPTSPDDRDYYYHYHGIRCNSNLDIKSIIAKFINPNDTILFQESRKGKYIALELEMPQEKIDNHEKLELRISFTTGQPDKIIILERHTGKDFGNKDSGMLMVLGFIIIFVYIIWTLSIPYLSKKLSQYSLLRRQIIAGIISIIILILLFTLLKPIFFGC